MTPSRFIHRQYTKLITSSDQSFPATCLRQCILARRTTELQAGFAALDSSFGQANTRKRLWSTANRDELVFFVDHRVHDGHNVICCFVALKVLKCGQSRGGKQGMYYTTSAYAALLLICYMYGFVASNGKSADTSSSEYSAEDPRRDCDRMCAAGTRCVITVGRTACRPTQKAGRCPLPVSAETGCFTTCDDDADCGAAYKCCDKRCGGRGCKKYLPF
ncbi:hypothetical protein BV898_06076 [Hypsibius exemplaris]|uniref:WAP domain-containing protein n=1 Tax=Hypsibius exemplaris TaxID=2072580 RepID=A0A1W0WX68_HYPEX|nr:hypothetical protein BV898_06076 [Hypsibius exemplaris]